MGDFFQAHGGGAQPLNPGACFYFKPKIMKTEELRKIIREEIKFYFDEQKKEIDSKISHQKRMSEYDAESKIREINNRRDWTFFGF